MMGGMLNLQSATHERWLRQVGEHLDQILIDHAHCEKKAAGTAMNLFVAYIENQDLCQAMTEIVNEELAHFHLVIDLLNRRGIRFRRQTPSQYGRRLNDLVRKQEPQRAVDRLLVAGLIEARSCERFDLLRKRLAPEPPPGPRVRRFLRQPVRVRGPPPQHLRAAGQDVCRR